MWRISPSSRLKGVNFSIVSSRRSTLARFRGETESARNPRVSTTRFNRSSTVSASAPPSSMDVVIAALDALLS